VNTKLQFANEGVHAATSTRDSNGSLPAARTNSHVSIEVTGLRRSDQRNGKRIELPLPVVSPATPTPQISGRARRVVFRGVRLVLSGALLSSAAFYTRQTVDQAASEQAYINGEITALRAPISGQLQIATSPGRVVRAGETLFSVENTRFGNQEVSSQLNWATETAERLAGESEEAALRFKQQQEVFRIHEKLFEEQVLSRLGLLEEQTRLEVARAVMTNKQALSAQAQTRCLKIKGQVDLQRIGVVDTPFDGVAWAVPAKHGAEVSTRETVVEVLDPKRIWVDAFFAEKNIQKLAVGTRVQVKSLDGALHCGGTIQWVRAGVGRIASEGNAAVNPGEYTKRRVTVRVRLDSISAFNSSEFYGVGRNVIVTTSHE
jgi:multidrug resistance efflux pump